MRPSGVGRAGRQSEHRSPQLRARDELRAAASYLTAPSRPALFGPVSFAPRRLGEWQRCLTVLVNLSSALAIRATVRVREGQSPHLRGDRLKEEQTLVAHELTDLSDDTQLVVDADRGRNVTGEIQVGHADVAELEAGSPGGL